MPAGIRLARVPISPHVSGLGMWWYAGHAWSFAPQHQALVQCFGVTDGLLECWNVFCFKVAHWHNILCQNSTWCLLYVILVVFCYRVQSDLHTDIDTDALCESSGIDVGILLSCTLFVIGWKSIPNIDGQQPNRNTQATAVSASQDHPPLPRCFLTLAELLQRRWKDNGFSEITTGAALNVIYFDI